MTELSRRAAIGATLAGAGVLAATAAAAQAMPERGTVEGAKVDLPKLHAGSEVEGPLPNPDPMTRRLGVAVVGLGHLTLQQILPAFGTAKHVRLAGLVSGTPEKARAVADQYGLPKTAVRSYAEFDRIADDSSVDIAYIVLPNALHAEYVVRAAKAGKHILCEKPMATNVADAERMVAAAREAGRQLMIAYRCQYEPHHRAAIKLLRAGEFGRLRSLDAVNTQNDRPGQWRDDKRLAGGGSLPDVGLYCWNAFRYLTGEEPIEIAAHVTRPAGDPRFEQIEDYAQFRMVFPSGVVAQGMSGYSGHETRALRAVCERGAIEFENAFAYDHIALMLARKVETGGGASGRDRQQHAEPNQFATEMDHFAERIRSGQRPRTPGEEGLQDMRIQAAIYRAAESGGIICLPRVEGLDTTRGPEVTNS